MKKHRGTTKSLTPSRTLFLGVGISFFVIVITAIIAAGILMTSNNPIGNTKVASLVTLLISGSISGAAISKMKGEGAITASLLSSLITSALILAVSLILTKGEVNGMIFMNCLCYILISIFFSFLAKKRTKHRRR